MRRIDEQIYIKKMIRQEMIRKSTTFQFVTHSVNQTFESWCFAVHAPMIRSDNPGSTVIKCTFAALIRSLRVCSPSYVQHSTIFSIMPDFWIISVQSDRNMRLKVHLWLQGYILITKYHEWYFVWKFSNIWRKRFNILLSIWKNVSINKSIWTKMQ